ncbi:unnamed protein product [Trifolium pratense]|uniref:Uncharacterized protein n=1 Tax=Trifolium pratense TaxID=57577 RepID=A0ACB0LML2_TRIPR|nr:unnamed protein product [Trifolium pratense]
MGKFPTMVLTLGVLPAVQGVCYCSIRVVCCYAQSSDWSCLCFVVVFVFFSLFLSLSYSGVGFFFWASIDALMVVGHNDLLCVGSFAGSDLVLLSSVLIVVDVWLWSKEECHNSKVRLSFNRTTAAESFFLSPKHFLQRSLWCFVFGFWTLMFSEIVLMLLFAFWFVVAAFALQSDCGSLLSGFGFDIRLSLGCGAQWSPSYRLFWLFFLASVGVLGLVCFCFAFDGFIT